MKIAAIAFLSIFIIVIFTRCKSGLEVTTWDDALQNPEKVTKIWFLDQKSGEYIQYIKRLSKVSKIYIGQDNSLTELPHDMEGLSSLKELNIYKTEIKSLPRSFYKNKSLEKIILHENRIEGLHDEVALLPNLKELSLAQNRITYLPNAIANCPVLEELDLSNNPINELPITVTKIKTLRILRLEGTNIGGLPNEIGELSNLEELRMQYNSNNTFPASLPKLTKLSTLAINTDDKADWKELGLVIGKITSLKHLAINSKTLKAIPNSFSQLKNLEHLDLIQTELPPSAWKNAIETLEAMPSLRLIQLPIYTPEVTKNLIQKAAPKAKIK
ncbi:MAG: hypothetical protein GY810_08140 [Aureispira sp.]|nr:hypothetical protein [Aureispira sp.]